MFRFKQFIVNDDRCGMKVGTDGVLLGAWAANLSPHGGIKGGLLDIGTGSGLIALMLAQRFPNAHILGIDIEANAVEQARENFAASPWASRLQAQCISLQELAVSYLPPSWGDKRGANLIVSNPPFFQNSLKNPNVARSTARHTDTLSYDELLQCSVSLLADEGILALILPIEAEATILEQAKRVGLTPLRLCRVRGNERKPYKRIMVEFQKRTEQVTSITDITEQVTPITDQPPSAYPAALVIESLTLETAPNHRSPDYTALTQDFYL